MTRQTACAESPFRAANQVAIVDSDATYRESLGVKLMANGYHVVVFEGGDSALEYFGAGRSAGALLLEWRTPGIDGAKILQSLRQWGIETPAIVLTSSTDQNHECDALRCGAVDFISKSRRMSIILKRLQLIGPGRGACDVGSVAAEKGPLVLRPKSRCAQWNGFEVPLTRAEFAVLRLLASQPGADVAYRAIYDVVRGKGFAAGKGPDGYRTNVRSFVKRVRNKIRNVDPEFDCIKNYFGFGYRWEFRPSLNSNTPGHGQGFPARPPLQWTCEPRRVLGCGNPGVFQ